MGLEISDGAVKNYLTYEMEKLNTKDECAIFGRTIMDAYRNGLLSKKSVKLAKRMLDDRVDWLSSHAPTHLCATCNKECDCGQDTSVVCLDCSVCAGVA